MSLNKDGVIIVLSSPSGAGKTTLVKKISLKETFKVSISYTTRIPRINEINGKDYYFVTKKKFEELKNNNFFVETAKNFNNFYGSPFKNINKSLKKNNIFYLI